MTGLYISWDTGHLNICDLDEFFPISLQDFRKLLKVIDLDHLHRDSLLKTLKSYCKEKSSECLQRSIGLKADWQIVKQTIADIEQQIQIGSMTKTDLRKYKTGSKELEAYVKENLHNIARYERYYELILERL